MFKQLLVAAIVLTVVVQNTCPYGLAAKTSFATCGATKQSSPCPMHKQRQSKQNGQDDAKRGISNAKQHFVLHMANPDNTYQRLDRSPDALSVDSLSFAEIFSDPLLRPPISFVLA
jgi:hypothetical protein